MTKRKLTETVKHLLSRIKLRWPTLSYSALPLIVLAGFSLASITGYAYTSANLNISRKLATDQLFKNNDQLITTTMEVYVNILTGSAGEMQDGSATQGKWSDFISTYQLDKNFKGIEAIVIAKGNTVQETSVAYVSPLTKETDRVMGTNLAQNPVVAKAMERSFRTDTTTIAGPIQDMFSTKTNVDGNGNGFYLIKPYYEGSMPHSTLQERTKALRGFTIGMLRGDIFFDEIYKEADLANKRVSIYLGGWSQANLMYDNDYTLESDQRVDVQKLMIYGHEFIVMYTQDTSKIVPFSVAYLPQYLLFVGLGLGLLVAILSGYLLRNRYRQLLTQKERDVDFAKDELLSLASHQLRTPATGVKQYLGMVLQGFSGTITEQQRKYLEQAYRSNNRQLHIINDILHLAKLESGRIVLAEHKFDFAEMLRDVVDEQKNEAESGDITLKLIAPSSGMMIGDSHMLRMVVENLINNSIKYTESNGTVTIRLSKRGMHWMLSVKDTGVGIAKKDLNKLFKQFSRIANVRSDYVTGTGIGLYLAHHLVVLHGGTISVTSEERKGSTFIVRLPRKM